MDPTKHVLYALSDACQSNSIIFGKRGHGWHNRRIPWNRWTIRVLFIRIVKPYADTIEVSGPQFI